MVEAALLPGVRMSTAVPLSANVGDTAGAVTVAATVVVAERLPDVPVTVAVYEPGVVAASVLMVSVAETGPVPVIAEGCVVVQVGRLATPAELAMMAQVSATLPVNPLAGVKVMVEVPLAPAAKAARVVPLKEKVGNAGAATVMATPAVWDSAPEVAVRARA